ncbi:hypothetical protein CJD36_020815 [Flavipsychrobacter stenotrophus]|uniref:Uncharacterized protein n=1 Tax=Flavipsychrobacter stenotrophus TaxID=2077091 RepID=A0A2S7SQJ3_9BACT|nr:hypothetical protein [Flavipsychrobacter stenotrophus]PQJ09024.1 hypothetical protein CJD36_020815 [Flavipsychrobacter stenotrophus]
MSLLSRTVTTVIIVIGLIISVAHAGGKKGVKKKYNLVITNYTEENDVLVRPVMNVPASSIGQIGLTLNKPFNKVRALHGLIPGRRYHVSPDGRNDTVDLIVWKSNDYTRKKLAGWFLNEPPEIFPFRGGNISMPEDTLLFKDDSGRKNIILSFATHDLAPIDDLSTGRYACVTMGLAWFREENNKWVLKYFTPGIGCYGAFQSLPKLNLIKLGTNNYACYLLNSNGGPGQVYYSGLYVFAIVDGQVRIVLTEDAVERTNTMSSTWYPHLTTFKTKSDSVFRRLSLKLEGTFNRNIPNPEYDTTDSPIELAKAIIGRDSFDFRVTRCFEYRNGKYRKVSSRYKVK